MSQDTNAFEDIPIVSGRELADRQNELAAQKVAAPVSALAGSDQARAIAEVQASLVIAQANPRNEVLVRDKLERACLRIGLASRATYSYPRGKTIVSGASIRLAEEVARCWGNMTYGFREISRDVGESQAEAFAWDLETNTKAVRQFTVRHIRDKSEGGEALSSERDIYELIANNAQRRVRAAILEIVPGDIVEEAIAKCQRTVKVAATGQGENAKSMPEIIQGIIETFDALGVSRQIIEKRLGHRLDKLQPAEVISLANIHNSIKDGMSSVDDWFDMIPIPTPDSKPDASKKAPRAKSSPTTEPTTKQQPDAPKKEPQASTGPEPDSAIDPEYQITCPKTGRPVDELDCAGKACRDGCPEFD